MKFPDEARAIRGRPVQPAWVALEGWVDGLPAETITGRDVHISEFPDERLIHFASRPDPWRYPLKVSVSGVLAAIRPGLCNLVMPRIVSTDGRTDTYLDGITLAGLDTGTRPALPVLDHPHGGPGADGRSYVCLVAAADLATGELAPVEVPDGAAPAWALTVEPRVSLPAGFESGGMPETLDDEGRTVGVWPLAILYWDAGGSAVRRVFQVVHHNLVHRYQVGAPLPEPGARGPGRHWFFGAT